MHRPTARASATVIGLVATAIGYAACKPVTPIVTTVARSVSTLVLVKTNQVPHNCAPGIPPAPDIMAWWNGLPAANHAFPFAGWESYRNATSGCTFSRIDEYAALATFNMTSVANLKGLVQKAELVVETRATPPAVRRGGAVTVGPFGNPTSVTLMCPELMGGGGSVVRFGPAAAGTLPAVSMAGELNILSGTSISTPPPPFPAGQTVYTFPPNMDTPGAVAGATNPTSGTANGTGGSIFVSDVTSSVVAALNGGNAAMSWMVLPNFTGNLPGAVPAGSNLDCRTSYDFQLKITHL